VSRLFSDKPRTNRSPATETEGVFPFLDRAGGPFWQRVRDNLEEWVSEYPEDARASLVRRLQSTRGNEHRGAWWELYLHAAFVALDADISVIVDGAQRQPDFLVRLGPDEFFLEGTTVTGGFPEVAGRGRIVDLINEFPTPPALGVSLHILVDGSDGDHPRKSELHGPIRGWLNALGDPEKWPERQSPPHVVNARGWVLELTAMHMTNRGAGDPDRRLIVAGPAVAGFLNERQILKTAISAKATRYGRLDLPLVVGVLVWSSLADAETVAQALYGSEVIRIPPGREPAIRTERARDGVYMHTSGEQNTRLAGVVIANDARPWHLGARLPDWWPHPWAERSVNLDSCFPTWGGTEAGMVIPPDLESQPDPRDLFGLGADWPGPESAFGS
jgi:hypothetical protein